MAVATMQRCGVSRWRDPSLALARLGSTCGATHQRTRGDAIGAVSSIARRQLANGATRERRVPGAGIALSACGIRREIVALSRSANPPSLRWPPRRSRGAEKRGFKHDGILRRRSRQPLASGASRDGISVVVGEQARAVALARGPSAAAARAAMRPARMRDAAQSSCMRAMTMCVHARCERRRRDVETTVDAAMTMGATRVATTTRSNHKIESSFRCRRVDMRVIQRLVSAQVGLQCVSSIRGSALTRRMTLAKAAKKTTKKPQRRRRRIARQEEVVR